MIVELKQELLDPEMAQPVGFCRRCGGEIYTREALERQAGLCRTCAEAEAARDEEENEGGGV